MILTLKLKYFIHSYKNSILNSKFGFMDLFQQISKHIRNTQLPIQNTISDLNFSIRKYTTYNELIRIYDPNIINPLKHKGFFDQRIVVFQAQMMPQNMHWILWKNYNEILSFLDELNQNIDTMKKVPQFGIDKFGNNVAYDISQQFMILKTQFDKGLAGFNQNLATRFCNFMNKLGQQLYIRKTINFLIFIGHCISIDKWNVMIHHQAYLYKDPSCITNKFLGLFIKQTQKKQIDFFVTITSDGILVSDDHLMLSKVQSMVPFTNKMMIKCYLTSDQNFIYEVASGRTNSLKFNFYKDYIAGANFGCGLGLALKCSGYNILMGVDLNQDAQEKCNLRSVPNIQNNRFDSYAQKRQNCNAKFYSDGCGYYQDLYNQLMKAQKQVCITGWMISPYFLLKRPGNINQDQYRLDGVLSKLASRGVKIFIIVFMEPSLLVNNDSEHVQTYLEGLHKNIKVYRHPNVAVPQLWSHHQKLVVIDQKIGFMGGLDICWGRWDTHQHRLVQNEQKADRRLWDGCDFNNYRLKDIYTPRDYWKSNLNKDFQPRMPWHDIAVQIRGDVVVDLLRHFVQYWYFVKSQLTADPRRMFVLLQKRFSQANSYTDQMQKRYLFDQLKNQTQQTFAQKFNSFKQKLGIFTFGGQQRISELLIQQRTGMNQGNLNIQMLRSASQWSIGLDIGKFQSSIHNAYKDLIQNSQSHIYIENQFFMGLQNKIVQSIANRIIRAKQIKQKFRVVVVMPLLPGFEGYIADPAASVLRIQMHWQYQAITRGNQSLHKRLINNGFTRQQINDYIFFFGLRKGQVLNNIPITEIIYVHSKLMIVDDKRMIIGSANINDRSLLGNRDSQIAICVETLTSEETRIKQFRQSIFQQHFGLTLNSNTNTLDDNIWIDIQQKAHQNTQIFRRVFGCVPDDKIKTIAQIQPFQEKNCDISRWFTQSGQIRGHAVDFPLQFLQKQDLTFKMTQKQYLAPIHTFT